MAEASFLVLFPSQEKFSSLRAGVGEPNTFQALGSAYPDPLNTGTTLKSKHCHLYVMGKKSKVENINTLPKDLQVTQFLSDTLQSSNQSLILQPKYSNGLLICQLSLGSGQIADNTHPNTSTRYFFFKCFLKVTYVFSTVLWLLVVCSIKWTLKTTGEPLLPCLKPNFSLFISDLHNLLTVPHPDSFICCAYYQGPSELSPSQLQVHSLLTMKAFLSTMAHNDHTSQSLDKD